MMSDLIRRQDAIDELKEHRAWYCDNTPDTFSKLSYAEKSRVDELDTAIATLVNLPSVQPEPQWIPCSERLPEDTGDYLVWALFVCEEYPTYSIVHYDADCEAFGEWDDIYDTHTLGFLDSVFEEIEGVIAWMPLPPSYKGELRGEQDV